MYHSDPVSPKQIRIDRDISHVRGADPGRYTQVHTGFHDESVLLNTHGAHSGANNVT